MNQVTLNQVPILVSWQCKHPHQCKKCDEWTIFGCMSYSEEIEETIFLCQKCNPDYLSIPLPKKTEFRLYHTCMDCKQVGFFGVLTFCPRCEDAEFICPLCLQNWFDNIAFNEYGYEFRPMIES